MDNMAHKSNSSSSPLLMILNGLCLLLTMVLSVVAFFAILEIVLVIGEYIVTRTVETPLRQVYTVGTLRNAWLFCGGALLLGFLVGGFDYHSKRLGKATTRPILLRTLAVEIIIIAISLFF